MGVGSYDEVITRRAYGRRGASPRRRALLAGLVLDEDAVVDVGDAGRSPGGSDRVVVLRP